MNMPRLQVILSIALLGYVGPAIAGQGLLGEYYGSTSLGFGSTASRIEGPIDFNFKSGSTTPLAGGQADNIATRWTGMVSTQGLQAGIYTFQTSSDDGCRIYVAGKLLRNDWTFRGEPNPINDNATMVLAANTEYAIQFEFNQGDGGVAARLRWLVPPGVVATNQVLNPIPLANLVPPPAASTTGLLTMSASNSPAAVNLTTVGQLDFAHYGLGGVGNLNRKTGVNFINNFGAQGASGEGGGTAAVAVTNNPTTFTWTGGAPTATATNTATSVQLLAKSTRANSDMALGNGFGMVLPADTTERVARIYVGLSNGTAKFEARLSDNSAPIVTETVTSVAQATRLYVIRYRANRANQMIAMTWTMPQETVLNGGGVTLGAIAVNQVPITTAITPTPTTVEGVPLVVNLTGSDPDSAPLTYNIVVPPQFGSITGGTGASRTYTPTNPLFSGTDTFTYVVNDGVDDSPPRTVTIQINSVNNGSPMLVNDSATTSDNVPVTVNVLANDTILDTPFTVSIAIQPANGTAVVNADNTITYIGNLSFLGTDTLTYRVTDKEGDVSTATVTINVTAIPPTITSPLSVNAIQGLQFTYKITASGTQPMTYTAAPLPSGLILVGDTITGFLQAGSYAVTLSATNSAASDVRTLIINAILQTPNLDTDGDGFTDEFEIGVGSSPVDPNSTPFTILRNGAGAIPPGIPPPGSLATAKPFFVSSVAIKLDFKSTKPTRDSIAFKGTLPVPATFSSSIQGVAINVGGITVSGTLDPRGSYTSANKLVKIKVGKTRTSLAGANAPISVSAKGVYAGGLTDEGYSNVTVSKATGKVVLYVACSTEYFSATVNTEYSARAGQKGSVKNSKR